MFFKKINEKLKVLEKNLRNITNTMRLKLQIRPL